MKKYTVTSTNFEGQIEIAYTDDGYLHYVDARQAQMGIKQRMSFFHFVPQEEMGLEDFKKQSKSVTITEVPEDLTFERFWKEYNYKVGNQKRAKELWNKLNAADKTKALQIIPRYNAWLKLKSHMERVYPETYLSQRRFENEYK